MYKKVLTIQDISCVGQCSLTVALPVLSACRMETVILPSAILSTHTSGFEGYTCRDLTDDMDSIVKHWEKEGIFVDCVYTGYLAGKKQIEKVIEIASSRLKNKGYFIVDPAMADDGELYGAFDMEFVNEMKKLVAKADIILPNITEACFLTGTEYRVEYDEDYIIELLKALEKIGAREVILTGVGYKSGSTGVVVWESGRYHYYEHEKIERGCHGTGDVYASSFVGALMNDNSSFEAAKIAADFTLSCIKNTLDDKDHWYGVKFEPMLKELIDRL